MLSDKLNVLLTKACHKGIIDKIWEGVFAVVL